jgi:hypothetical protein
MSDNPIFDSIGPNRRTEFTYPVFDDSIQSVEITMRATNKNGSEVEVRFPRVALSSSAGLQIAQNLAEGSEVLSLTGNLIVDQDGVRYLVTVSDK